MASDRYIAIPGSQSANWGFEGTVVDTTRPKIIGGERYLGQFEEVCECFDMDDAQRIAAALNAVESNDGDGEKGNVDQGG